MEKKIILGSIIAVVFLTLVSFTSVVGYSNLNNNPDGNIEIIDITGGLGIKSEIHGENINSEEIDISIELENGLVLLPLFREKKWTYHFGPQDSITVSTFALGFGNVDITVTADAGDGIYDTRTTSGFIFGPFVKIYGGILYVGGTGPGNYTYIQDAVDNAYDGDTIFVYSGTYTYKKPDNRGCVDIRQKSITLLGEDKNTTILDGNWSNGIVHVDAPVFRMSGFTVRNSGSDFGTHWFGIEIGFNYNEDTTISDNIIYGHEHGIIVWGGRCSIYNNIISDNEGGIYMSTANGKIFNNILSENGDGIAVSGAFISVYDNIVENNNCGIYVFGGNLITVRHNNIEGNEVGLVTSNAKARIKNNNFINNEIQASYSNGLIFINLFLPFHYRLNWRGNYWNDWSSRSPRPINGYWSYIIFSILEIIGPFPSIQFDFLPSTTLYDI